MIFKLPALKLVGNYIFRTAGQTLTITSFVFLSKLPQAIKISPSKTQDNPKKIPQNKETVLYL